MDFDAFHIHSESELNDNDAPTMPAVYDDNGDGERNPMSIAADGFVLFLERLYRLGRDSKGFSVMGYAALWHMNPDAFGGLNQKQVAAKAGITHENFCRAVKRWALNVGYSSRGMKRARDGTRQQLQQARQKRRVFHGIGKRCAMWIQCEFPDFIATNGGAWV
jgi:hypothetical protein